jgi:HEAT repeat protein
VHELPPPPDPAVVERVRATIVAGHRGDRDAIEAALADASPTVREAALAALVRVDGAAGMIAVQAALGDDAARVRARASELAPHVGVDPQALLADNDDRVVEVTCFACGEIDWDELQVEPPISELSRIATSHDDALCRESAAAALGAIGDERGLDAVLHACGDRVTVRRRATLALAAFDDPRADAALEHALEDKDWQVRQAAEDLLEVGRVLDGEPDPDAYADS